MNRPNSQYLKKPRRSTRFIQSSTSVTSKGPFPFLKLPGEIRNSIYEYYVGVPKFALKHRGGVCTERDRSHSILTQINQQIRKEFRPLYLRSISINLSKAEKFAKAFFKPSWDAEIEMRLLVNIYRPRNADPVNISLFLTSTIRLEKPLVRFHCRRPGRSLAKACCEPGRNLAKALNKALRNQKKKWQALVKGSYISKFYLRPFEDSLAIVFSNSGFESWLEERNITKEEFCIDLGFKKHYKIKKLELLREVHSSANDWQLLYGYPRQRII